MKRLMLDYFRRWWWLLAIAGVLEFWLGWFVASRPESPFEFYGMMLAMWTGALLVSYDLRRGALRALAVLPLRRGEIGRAWWLVSVPIPALGLGLLLFLGAGARAFFHAGNVFPLAPLVLLSLFTSAWLGIGFTMISASTRGIGDTWLGMLGNFVVNTLSTLLFFGSMLLCLGATHIAWRAGVLLGGGALLTVVGWRRGEQFDPARAWLYLGGARQPDMGRLERVGAGQGTGLTPLKVKPSAGNYRVPAGPGGLGFMLRNGFVRMVCFVGPMIGLMWLLSLLQKAPLPRAASIAVLAETGSFLACGFVLVMQLLPVLRQLRLLRTMPISAGRLAAVLILLLVLPLLAVGTLAAAIASPALGHSAALVFLGCYAFVLAPGSLCVFFIVWLGEGIPAYALGILTLFESQKLYGWLRYSTYPPQVPLGTIGLIAVAGVVLGWLLTRWALEHSSRSYRVRLSPLGSFPWTGGR